MEIEMRQCLKCSYEFEWKFQVDHHVQREHTNVYAAELFHAIVEPEQFSCICCKFPAYYNLYEHCKQKHHGNIIDEDMEQSSNSSCDEGADNEYPCGHCAFKSDSCLFLVKHIDEARSPTADDLIEKNIDRKTRMLKHGFSENIDWFKCTKCSYKSKHKGSLKRHMLTHGSGEAVDWLKCVKCSYRAQHEESLKRHMLKHASSDDIDFFKCTKCSYKSKHKGSLEQHMLTHASSEDINWFQCAKCSFKSKYEQDLKQHMVFHASSEDIDWFQCAKCSFKSNNEEHMRMHMRIHDAIEDIDWFQDILV